MKTLCPVDWAHFYTAAMYSFYTSVISHRVALFIAGGGCHKFLRNAIFLFPAFQMIGERYFNKEFIVMPVPAVAFFHFAFIISLVYNDIL